MGRKSPALVGDLRLMVATLLHNLLGIRDCALLPLGFAGAFHRSEPVGLNIEDVAEVEEGLQVWAIKGKNDQEGEGELKCIPYGGELLKLQVSTRPTTPATHAGAACPPVVRLQANPSIQL